VTTTMVRPTRVLLIAGTDADADHFGAVLEATAPAAFEVTRATSLAEGAAYLDRTTTDCAVIDVALAGDDDLACIDTLATRSPSVALVALTGRAEDAIGVATRHAGPVDLLSKGGLQGNALVGSIRHAIRLKRVEASLDEAQSIAQIGSWEVDLETNTVTWSHELYRMLGFGLEQAPGYDELVARIHTEDRDATMRALRAAMEDFTPFVIEHRNVLPDGSVRWIRARGRVELDADGRPERLLGTAQDITDEKAADAARIHHELHDPLTGLPNRQLLVDRIGQALTRLTRTPAIVAVIHLDVDRFKVINDSLGHGVGDALLVQTARRLRDLIRPEDTLARIEGDEFVVLCEGLTDQAAAVQIADRICAAMTEPFAWSGGELVLSVSAGIALALSPSGDAGALLGEADAAMYRAKAAGRARSVVFTEGMRPTGVGRLDTETSLRKSIVNGDLRVHYQPIVNLVDGQVLGHEALVRWAHPARGLLGPDEFIAVAEESGLIVPLGAWVLREACMQAKRFQTRDPRWPRLMMSVNLSGAQLGQRDLVELIASALQDADLDPEDLQLEMTESVLMDDAPTTINVLRTLKGLGVHLSIDDFGTGYSSLAYLRRFPVDVLKIDRTFVGGLGKDHEDSAIVAAVVNLADTLGFATIAEGVETELQRECLVGLGCSRAQGYLFARPVAAAEAESALDRVAGATPSR
jgi:diguanylate cyclase (GGDEF)-like protein/PAS domain S-box-containing protein